MPSDWKTFIADAKHHKHRLSRDLKHIGKLSSKVLLLTYFSLTNSTMNEFK